MTFSFRDLTLAEAECEIVGAAIDHEHALLTALRTLAVDDFRSEAAADLRRVFYVLAGWYARGEWDRWRNLERLAQLYPGLDLWSPSAVLPEYVRALCLAVVESNRLADAAVGAVRDWRGRNPLALASQSPVARRTPPRPKHTGGVS